MTDAERLSLWRSWGDGYALYTRCGGCGEIQHCRGARRHPMLCLDCFDPAVYVKTGKPRRRQRTEAA